jgi:hypothetical protein
MTERTTLRRVDDGDPFTAGWNAALDETIERIKKWPTMTFSAAPVTLVMIAKADVLSILRGVGEEDKTR